MSLEEYHNSDMRKAADMLSEIIDRKDIDWDRFDSALARVPDINTRYEEDTILSYLYCICRNGKDLVEITKRFLKNGYDVSANEGLNGCQCLHHLSWATYDRYILDAAKLLLDAGARTDLPLDLDENNDGDWETGVKSSISWDISGQWVEGFYKIANNFEAYWQLIDAFEAGKDYHSVRSFEECIREPLSRADFLPAGRDAPISSRDPLTYFDGHLVLWFGRKPLVISKYIDFVINPLTVEEKKDAVICADEYLRPLLNARLKRVYFLDQCTAQLMFDNSLYLLLSSTDFRDKEHRRGFFEIRTAEVPPVILNKQFHRLVLTPGKTYSDSCREFSENSLALLSDHEAFLLHSYPDDYHRAHKIRIVECSQQFVSEYKRTVVLPDLIPEETFNYRGKLSALRMRCGSEHFYIFTSNHPGLIMKLSSEWFTSFKELSRERESEKLEFCEEPPGNG